MKLANLWFYFFKPAAQVEEDSRWWPRFRGWPRRVHATARPAGFASITMSLGRAQASGSANAQVAAGWELHATLANVTVEVGPDEDEELLLLLMLLEVI